ncbi:MAG: ShlB/FhaC/HecB family hemolysin secretion/activation protein [Cellvibrionaceae bacterium]
MQKIIYRSVLFAGFIMFSAMSSAVTFFDIWEYRIEGVKHLDQSVVQRAVEPFLGEARTIDDIDKAAQAIQTLYQKAGYPTTAISVPNQDINRGVITLVVDETVVRQVKIVGSKYFSLDNIRKQFPSLEEGKVLNVPALQTQARLANQVNRDLKIVPALKASPQPGAIDVDLTVADELPFHGGIEVTNYHTETTTPTRLSADFRYGNLWQKNHEVSIQFQVTPENTDEVQVVAGSYLMPINNLSGKLALYAVDSQSQLSVAVNDIEVIGNGRIYGLRWVQPIKQTPRAIHSFSIGGDYKDFDENLELPGDVTITTPIQYSTFSAQYNLYHRGKKVTDTASTGFTFGSRLFNNDSSEFGIKRSQADSSFSLWRFNWKRAYQVLDNWEISHSIRGQITESPLVSNEQMSAGGVTSVRGYYESQIQGDSGWIGTIEILPPSWEPKFNWIDGVSPYLFYDASRLRLNQPLTDQQSNFSIASFGAGFKTMFFDSVHLKVESGYPLKHEGSIEKGDIATRASLRMDF